MPADPDSRYRRALQVELVVTDERWNSVPGLERIVALAQAAFAALPDDTGTEEVAIALGSDEEVHELNRNYRGKDKPTNVLSFPSAGHGDTRSLGDVILAYETCAEEAGDRDIPLSDHACHLALHGVLHLLGCDHETEAEAGIMEALETRLLAKAGISDPHADDLTLFEDAND